MPGHREREYEFELAASRAEVATVLSGVVDGLHAGTVQVSDDSETVTVDVPETLALEVELEIEDDEVNVELELTWEPDDEATVVRHDETAATDEEPSAGVSAPASAPPETGARADADVEVETEAKAELEEGTEEKEKAETTAETAPDSMARFELFCDRSEEWRWRLRHRNGNVIATSGEGYTRKHNALKGLRSVARNAPRADVTEPSE